LAILKHLFRIGQFVPYIQRTTVEYFYLAEAEITSAFMNMGGTLPEFPKNDRTASNENRPNCGGQRLFKTRYLGYADTNMGSLACSEAGWHPVCAKFSPNPNLVLVAHESTFFDDVFP
jgi:hypothetical protein